MELMSNEEKYVTEIEDMLWRRGFVPPGIAFVAGLLRDQHPVGSDTYAAFERLRMRMLAR
jgi:hypothetical protein